MRHFFHSDSGWLVVAALLLCAALTPTALADTKPIASAGDDLVASWGRRVRLDGAASADTDGDALAYRWTLLRTPSNSRGALTGADTPTPSLALDQPGSYIVQLVVNDGKSDSEPDMVLVRAALAGAGVDGRARPLRGSGGGSDVDGDGVPDAVDNCVENFNPSQLDSNGDGFGNRCDPDLDNDGFITNTIDLGLLRLAFFSSPGLPNWNPDADFDGNNVVNVIELGILKSFFFGPPGPIAITFINPAGGSWHDPNNWLPPVVPDTRYSVRIDLDPGVVVEYSSGNTEIASLQASSDLLISGGELSVVGSMQVNAPLTLSGSGTLANATVLAPTTGDEVEVPAGNTFMFDGVTLGADITLRNNAQLQIQNGLTLDNSTVTLASTGGSVFLFFTGPAGGPSTLGGTGEVVFGGTTTSDNSHYIYAPSFGLNIDPGVTVRSDTSGGRIDAGGSPLTIPGNVISDLVGRTVNITGNPVTLTGASLQAANGGSFNLALNGGSVIDVPINVGAGGDLTISGTWSNASGNLLSVSGGGDMSLNGTWTNDAGATISMNGGELSLFGDWTNAGQITVTDGFLDISNNTTDEWSNSGVIDAVNTTVELGGALSLAGLGTLNTTGDVLLNGSIDNTGMTLDVDTDLPGNVILVSGGEIIGGTLTGTSLEVPAGNTFMFDGVTLGADITLRNNAQLQIQNGLTLDNSTVTLASTGGSVFLFFTGPAGGPSTLGGTGEVVFGGTTTSDNSHYIYAPSFGLNIDPGVTVRSDTSGGRIDAGGSPLTIPGNVISDLVGRTVNITGNPVTLTGASLQAANGGSFNLALNGGSVIDVPINVGAGGDLTISGTWSNASGNLLSVSGGGDMSLNGTWTNDAGATISMNGGELSLFGDWTNAGQITVTDGFLDISNNTTDEWSNSGVIDAVNTTVELGGALSLAGLGTLNTTGDVLLNGSIDNTGMTLDVDTDLPGNVILVSGGEIIGGTLTGTSLEVPAGNTFMFDGVTLGADITLRNNAQLQIQNGLTLDNSTVTLASTGGSVFLFFTGPAGGPSTLGGTGEVVFGGITTSDNSHYIYAPSFGLNIDPGVTVRSDTSGGRIDAGGSPLTIPGNVISDLVGRTVNITGNPVTLTGASLQAANGGSFNLALNGGSVIDVPINVGAGGDLTISGTWSNASGNLLSVSGGGDMSLNGTWTNDAGATISMNGGELSLFGDWTNAGQITVTDGFLDISNNTTDEWSNSGVIDAVNTTVELGGALSLAGLGTLNTTGDVLLNGSIDNTGMTLDVDTDLPGNVILVSGGEIIGGTLTGTSLEVPAGNTFMFDGVTLGADITLRNNAQLQIQNGLTLDNSTVTLASTGGSVFLFFTGPAGGPSTLGGTGEVVFGGITTSDNSHYIYAPSFGLNIDPGVTVRSDTSGGRIDAGGSPLTIHGNVISDLVGRTVSVTGMGGSLSVEGTLHAGAGATINFSSDYVLANAASVNVDIGGTSTSDYGRVTAPSRTATLDGALNIALVNGFTPALSDTFEILSFANRNGTFATTNGTTIGGGLSFQANYNATDVTLEVIN